MTELHTSPGRSLEMPDLDGARVLIAIANHGTKNQHFLDRILAAYRSLPCEVHFLILSNIPKELGDDVTVLVGAPTDNPWSLPFAHKRPFVEELENYDYFIYSEDDTYLPEANFRDFIEAQRKLPDDEVVGFLRYEEGPDGTIYYSSVHSHYHFDLDSVKRVGDMTFAHYTNEHSALFVLSRDQLRRAIDSGGFDCAAHEGRYDMLCSAATDPYTRCGFRKLVPISHLERFRLHHMPNLYIGKLGVQASKFEGMVGALEEVAAGKRTRDTLFDGSTSLGIARYDKFFHENAHPDLLAAVGDTPLKVLSVGVGEGRLEEALLARRHSVTVIPMDAVVSSGLESTSARVLPPNFDLALEELGHTSDPEPFDVIILSDVLAHVPEPWAWLEKLRPHSLSGRLVATVPNLESIHVKRLRKNPHVAAEIERIGRFEEVRLHATSERVLKDWLRRAGFTPRATHWRLLPRGERLYRRTFGLLGRLLGTHCTIEAVARPDHGASR